MCCVWLQVLANTALGAGHRSRTDNRVWLIYVNGKSGMTLATIIKASLVDSHWS